MNLRDRFLFSEEVGRALAANRPVVALETTVVTHGLPQPQGLETALAMEAEVRANGATPATIGVLDGKVHVGVQWGLILFPTKQSPGLLIAIISETPDRRRA